MPMDDPRFAASRREDLDQFRRGKFGRTKSYAFGDGKMMSIASATQQVLGGQSQSKRNTAPAGLFTAGSVQSGRSRRSGGLQVLQEGGGRSSHDRESDGEETDVDLGESPCPPPTRGGPLKGRKIGRVPIARAETFDPSRMAMGY